MTRHFVSVLCVLMTIGAAQLGHARDTEGTYTVRGMWSCGEYLDAYSRTTLYDDGGGYKGPHEFWQAAGWINGYITSYNEWTANDKKDIAAGLSQGDVYGWVASWCRDNPSKELVNSTHAFIVSRGF